MGGVSRAFCTRRPDLPLGRPVALILFCNVLLAQPSSFAAAPMLLSDTERASAICLRSVCVSKVSIGLLPIIVATAAAKGDGAEGVGVARSKSLIGVTGSVSGLVGVAVNKSTMVRTTSGVGRNHSPRMRLPSSARCNLFSTMSSFSMAPSRVSVS